MPKQTDTQRAASIMAFESTTTAEAAVRGEKP